MVGPAIMEAYLGLGTDLDPSEEAEVRASSTSSREKSTEEGEHNDMVRLDGHREDKDKKVRGERESAPGLAWLDS